MARFRSSQRELDGFQIALSPTRESVSSRRGLSARCGTQLWTPSPAESRAFFVLWMTSIGSSIVIMAFERVFNNRPWSQASLPDRLGRHKDHPFSDRRAPHDRRMPSFHRMIGWDCFEAGSKPRFGRRHDAESGDVARSKKNPSRFSSHSSLVSSSCHSQLLLISWSGRDDRVLRSPFKIIGARRRGCDIDAPSFAVKVRSFEISMKRTPSVRKDSEMMACRTSRLHGSIMSQGDEKARK